MRGLELLLILLCGTGLGCAKRAHTMLGSVPVAPLPVDEGALGHAEQPPAAQLDTMLAANAMTLAAIAAASGAWLDTTVAICLGRVGRGSEPRSLLAILAGRDSRFRSALDCTGATLDEVWQRREPLADGRPAHGLYLHMRLQRLPDGRFVLFGLFLTHSTGRREWACEYRRADGQWRASRCTQVVGGIVLN